MGILVGEKEKPLPYTETKKYQCIIKKNVACQVAKLLQKFGNFEKNQQEQQKYGTEVEFFVMKEGIKKGQKIYQITSDDKKLDKTLSLLDPQSFDIHIEYSKFMKEAVPKEPFTSYLNVNEIYEHFRDVTLLLQQVKDYKFLFGGCCLPFLGSKNQFHFDQQSFIRKQSYFKHNQLSQATSFLDDYVTQHPRIVANSMNNRIRSQKMPQIKIPIFQDQKTQEKYLQMDHVAYGFCLASLQVTFSSKNLQQCRFLFDQFHILSPLFLALSASTSIFANRLLDTETRFEIEEQSSDDRNPRELQKIELSRFSFINYYISDNVKNKKKYNDKRYTINKKMKNHLKKLLKQQKSKFQKDDNILNHFAYQCIRDQTNVFPNLIKNDNCDDTVDLEMIGCANWNNVKIKPPSNFDDKIGWLIEFRPMDNPLLDKEKCALIYFATLWNRIITDERMDINMYIEMSKVHENMKRSMQRNAINNQKIFFRQNWCGILNKQQKKETKIQTNDTINDNKNKQQKIDDEIIVELSFQEFIQGTEQFIGVKDVIQKFIEINKDKIENQEIEKIWNVYNFVLSRTNGQTLTSAQYMRKYILQNKLYKQDSTISDELCTELIDHILQIQQKDECEEIVGKYLQFMNKEVLDKDLLDISKQTFENKLIKEISTEDSKDMIYVHQNSQESQESFVNK